MLDVTINLIPYGDAAFSREIVNIIITNDMTGTPERGNYWVLINGVDYEVKDFDRTRGALALVGEVAKAWEGL